MNSPLRWIAVLVLALLAVTPFVLHFGQKRHNHLDYDVEAQFPEATPIVGGEALSGTLGAVVQHELDGYTGWRPNDFVLWGPHLLADNNANRQMGIILAVRETVRVFKDHLTKVSSDEYDGNLQKADTAFRNDMERLWLPSAESKLEEGIKHLGAYRRGLAAEPRKSKPLVKRNVELIRLFQTWTDMLGDAHGALYRTDIGFLETDDVYYHAQGVTHVLGFAVRAIDREYRSEIRNRPVLEKLMQEVADALARADELKPLVVLDGNPDGILANHRRNLDGYITEARQKMYSIREELEK